MKKVRNHNGKLLKMEVSKESKYSIHLKQQFLWCCAKAFIHLQVLMSVHLMSIVIFLKSLTRAQLES